MPGDLFRSDDSGPTRRVAVLPFAYRDAAATKTCDLCPDRVVMDLTSQDDALLATAFVYEGLARYPRIQVVPFERVRDAEGATMRETVTNLAAREELDAVIVGALLELRPRLGDPRAPTQRGGAALYVAVLDLPSGSPFWKRVYDRSPAPPGRILRGYHKVVGEEDHSFTANEAMQGGIERMVPSLVQALR